jgi:hypothetical protein
MSTEGDKRHLKSHGRHKSYFAVEKDSADEYLVETCTNAGMKDIFRFLCPILDPTRPSRVHIFRFNQVYLLLRKQVKVNRTKNLYRALYKIAMQVGLTSTLYLSPFLFHFYNQYNTLTRVEKAQYIQAQAAVQELLAQATILIPVAP